MTQFNAGSFGVFVQFYRYDRSLFLFAKVPLLNDFFIGFEFQVFTNDAAFPKRKSDSGSVDITALSPVHNSMVTGLVIAA
jgi:hypothetical protein